MRPQPIYENFTIDINGYELTKFLQCYWRNNLVNFNGKSYAYQEGNWTQISHNEKENNRYLINKFAFEDDNSLDILEEETNPTNTIINQMSVLAEVMAVINEHDINNNLTKPHASTVLIGAQEKRNYNFLNPWPPSHNTWKSFYFEEGVIHNAENVCRPNYNQINTNSMRTT